VVIQSLESNQQSGCGSLVPKVIQKGGRSLRFRIPSASTVHSNPRRSSGCGLTDLPTLPSAGATHQDISNTSDLETMTAHSTTRTSARLATQPLQSVPPNSILGQWLAIIRDPLTCPTEIEGGTYLKGSHTYAIDEFIDCLKNNSSPRILRLQNINISDAQVRKLLDTLPSTYIYAMNLGEVDLDDCTRQHLCSVLPRTHLVQIFLKDLRDPALRNCLLDLLEANRLKVIRLLARLGESLP
jgi:hypothetical protein